MTEYTIEEALQRGSQPAQEMTVEEALGIPSQEPEWKTRVKEFGGKAASLSAATADLLAGAPGAAAGLLANVGGRIGIALAGGSPEEVRAAGAEWQHKIPEEWKAPFTNILQKLGGEAWDSAALSAAMEKGVEGVAAVTRVPAGDVQLVFDTLMAYGGLKGLEAGGKAVVTPKPQPTGKGLVTSEARAKAEPPPAKPVDLGTVDRAWEAVNKEPAARTPEDIAAMKEAAMMVQPSKVWGAKTPGTGVADLTYTPPPSEKLAAAKRAAALTTESKVKGSKVKGTGEVAEGYLVPAAPKGDILPQRARELMEKGGETLTPDEMTTVYRAAGNEIKAMRGQTGAIDPQTLIKLGLGATTLLATGSTAYLLFDMWRKEEHRKQQIEDFKQGYKEQTGQEPSEELLRNYEEQLRKNPKVRILPEQKPQPPQYRKPKEQWTMQDSLQTAGLLAMTLPFAPHSARMLKEKGSIVPPEARALGPALAEERATSTVFERLPMNKVEFGKEEIRSVLGQQGIMKADRDIFEGILQDAPGERLSAAQLVQEYQTRTGKFELNPQVTTQYANYGLENIGKASETANIQDMRTTKWQLPYEVSTANHFQDPNLFGWTRSFKEDGVRHVVEVQSDLAQHAKTLSPERKVELEQRLQFLREGEEAAQEIVTRAAKPDYDLEPADYAKLFKLYKKAGVEEPVALKELEWILNHSELAPKNYSQYFRTITDNFMIRYHETKAALEGGKVSEQINPMLKTWPQRLIREELAQAAKEGEKTVRFATADTVAKVEGWPDTLDRIDFLQHNIPKWQDKINKPSTTFERADWIRQIRNAQTELLSLNGKPRFEPQYQGIYDRYAGDITKFLEKQGGKHVTDETGNTWIEVPVPKRGPVKQFGRADTQMLATLSGIGLGGIIGSIWADDPIQGAVTGAIVGGLPTLPGARERIGKLAKGIDYTIGATSTRILEKSPELFKLLNDYKWKNAVALGDDLTRVVPWLEQSVNLPREQLELLQTAIFRKDKVALDKVNSLNPELAAGWKEVQAVLRERGQEASKLGRFKTLIEDYFPQRVKDYEGLMEFLGQETRTRLEQLIHEAEAKAARKHTVFTDTERDALINRELRNAYKTPSHLPAFAKARSIEDVTKDLQKFYHTPQEALHITLRELNNDIQLAKLFGKNLQQIKGADGKLYTDVETSVGNIVGEHLQKGTWSRAEQLELEGMIRALIGPGERGANPLLREATAIGYAATLGNVASAAVQLGDPLKVIYSQGPRAALTAMARRLTGKTQITPEHFHLSDHIAQEIAAGSGISLPARKVQAGAIAGGGALGATLGWRLDDDPWGIPVGALAGAYITLAGVAGPSAALNKIMRHTGFTKLDLFGKGTSLEAAILNAQRLSHTSKGTAELARKYEVMFGRDFPELIEDLKVKRMSDNVRSLAWIEASKDQPLSSLEMSEFQLAHPNARPAFMLKRWMLKQLDVYRRDVWNEIKKGDKESIARGLKNATAFSFVLGLSGVPGAMIADYLLGREIDFDWTDVPENVLKTFGFAEYTREKMAQGKPFTAAAGAFMPPWQIIDHVASGDPKAVRYIPILGKLYESHELGGKERMEIIKRNELRKQLEESFGRPLTSGEKKSMLPPLSPNAKLYQQQQREARSEAR